MARDVKLILVLEITQPTEDLIRPLQHLGEQHRGTLILMPPPPRGMLEHLPDFVSMTHQFADPVIAVAFLKNAKDVITTWLKHRSGRRLKLKAAGQTIEVTGPKPLDQAIELLELAAGKEPKEANRQKRPKRAATTRVTTRTRKPTPGKAAKKKTAPRKSSRSRRPRGRRSSR